MLLGFLALFAFFDLIARAARPGQRQLPAAPDLHRGRALGAGARLRAAAGRGADRHALRAGAPVEQFRVHRDARRGPVAARAPALRAGARSASPFVVAHLRRSASGSRRARRRRRRQVRMRAHELAHRRQTCSSGLWFKDERSFINVREAREANLLQRRAHLRVRRRLPPAAGDRSRSAPNTPAAAAGGWSAWRRPSSRAGGAAHRALRRGRMALGGEPGPAQRADRGARAHVGLEAVQVHCSTSPATGRRPSATRSRCGRSSSIRSRRW